MDWSQGSEMSDSTWKMDSGLLKVPLDRVHTVQALGRKGCCTKPVKNLTVSARRLDKTSLGFLVIDIAWRLSGSLGHHVSSS